MKLNYYKTNTKILIKKKLVGLCLTINSEWPLNRENREKAETKILFQKNFYIFKFPLFVQINFLLSYPSFTY